MSIFSLSIKMSTFLPSNLHVGDNVNIRVWTHHNHVHQHLFFLMSIIHHVRFHFLCKITHCPSPCLPPSHQIYAQVTMSTVGYGDIYCMTTLGRAFQVKKFCTFLMFFPLSLSLIRWCSSLSHCTFSLSRCCFHFYLPGSFPHCWPSSLCLCHPWDHWAARAKEQIWRSLQERERVGVAFRFVSNIYKNICFVSNTNKDICYVFK